jgi:chemotaxis protein MotB
MEEAPPRKKADSGAPAWVMTFADLMSLLMCFFVLLLSFSEMDVAKYKQIAGSMREAFGVQRKIKVKEPPKGINIIATEFSAGRPEPTPLNVIEQMTTDDFKRHLDVGDRKRRKNDQDEKGKKNGGGDMERDGRKLADDGRNRQMAMVSREDALRAARAKEEEERRKAMERAARRIRAALRWEIRDGAVDVETEGRKIIIRIREKASFPSGRARLRAHFRPVLARVGEIIAETRGQIIVAGHTDSLPISTDRFRSNWELSAARAVTVVHELIDLAGIPRNRFTVQGLADTQPVAPNDTPANRARNRRVEIILMQGEDIEKDGFLGRDLLSTAQ